MKSAVFSTVLAAALASTIEAHGQMTSPDIRPVSANYLANCGALKNAGQQELLIAPLENLSQRKQKDFPEGPSFDIMNGCRGMVYESTNPVTTLTAGVEFPVKWWIQAPHPGYAEFNIVKPKTGAGGKITYEKVVTLKRIEDFATSGGNFADKLTIPSSVTGCEKAGACALQMYWHSDVANQTYPNCADIIVKGSGGASSSGSTKPATTPAPAADDGEDTDESAAGEAETPATPAPAVTSAPAPAATKKKCTGKVRRVRA
uniref:Chitin-binding type-4 domain-containing protein n=1 Tax=Globisporangium ultimum (strain ATCC 200006 / CBS 805.95 / DAOM BR144) TaxID=431595 RepID=K3W980_GLOUD